jgi:hypothetical protein
VPVASTQTYNSAGQLIGGSSIDVVFNQSGGLLLSTETTTDDLGKPTHVKYYFTNGSSITLDAGTYTGASFNTSTNTLSATLIANGLAIGTLSLNADLQVMRSLKVVFATLRRPRILSARALQAIEQA